MGPLDDLFVREGEGFRGGSLLPLAAIGRKSKDFRVDRLELCVSILDCGGVLFEPLAGRGKIADSVIELYLAFLIFSHAPLFVGGLFLLVSR